jgi:hypothetical protein
MEYEIDGRVDKVKTALNMKEKKDRNEGKGDIYDYYDEIWEGVSKHALGDHSHDFITKEHNHPPKIKTNWRENWTLENEYSLKQVQSKPSTPAHKPPAYKQNEPRQRIRRASSDLNLKPNLPSQTTSPKMNNLIPSYLSPQAGSKPRISSDKSSKTASLNSTIISTASKANIQHAQKDQGVFDNKAQIILYMDQKVTKTKKTMVDSMNHKVNTELTEQISKLEKFFTKKVEKSLLSMNESIAMSFTSIFEIVLNDIAKISTFEIGKNHDATEKREEAQLETVKLTEKKTHIEEKARSSSLQLNHTHDRTPNKPKKVFIHLDATKNNSEVRRVDNIDMPKRPRLQRKSSKIDDKEDKLRIQIPKERSSMIKQGIIEVSHELPKIIELPQEIVQQSQESDIELEPQQPDALEKPREVPKPHPVVPRLNLSLI